ncbi:ABC transporter permease [Aestuariicella sp. G3-2]|uniref:ABC transporter permease n=1 Tax=Pseudomaricurvus albidus TaxID=2842452 RepID=UPI001C0D0A8F|nr:ABC transporter permease [Aestuariicella albida]MBU3068477.1 ABC transporter permease [Aestuariicella albida]
MNQLLHFVLKELRLLKRDLHGLLLLFAMPALFILIMTFALQNQYASNQSIDIDYYLLNYDTGSASQKLAEQIEQLNNFNRLHSDQGEAEIRAKVASDHAKFLIIIPPGFDQKLADNRESLNLESAPGVTPVLAQLVESQLQQKLNELFLANALSDSFDDPELADNIKSGDFIQTRSLYGSGNLQPSSVQQNVPAWMLFAMFFIAIPLSTTLINERQQGTLDRLRTMEFPRHLMLLGKLIPYFGINLLQVVIMLLIGVYLVPALGGDQLHLGNSYSGLALISICASLAAVAYALLVAEVANTIEQATIFSGICNIIMAAIGGVMVPRFIMPPVMQTLSEASPMAWGLDGFFDILLRNGTLNDVLPEAGALLGFALAMLIGSAWVARRRQAH